MKSFTAGPNENGVRLSRFVEGVTKDMPRSMMYKAFRNKRIKVNGKRAEPDTRLSAGDLIELYINDEFFPVGKPAAKTAKPPRRQPPVTVVYEDENFAVLYKPAHLLCHSDRTGDANLVPLRPIWRPRASMIPTQKSDLPRRCVTGWTAAPKVWCWPPRATPRCAT